MRYTFFWLIPLVLLSSCQGNIGRNPTNQLIEAVDSLYDDSLQPFYHGVASGDPLTDRVIIWTRVTPEQALAEISVQWMISVNENFDSILKSGSVTTTPAKDYTVKVDVTGLSPGTTYYYRFIALDKTSPSGRKKNTPRYKSRQREIGRSELCKLGVRIL